MRLAKTLACLSVFALAAAPVVTHAAQTSRIASPVSESDQLAEGGGMVVLLGFLAALAAVVIIASDDDEPSSP